MPAIPPSAPTGFVLSGKKLAIAAAAVALILAAFAAYAISEHSQRQRETDARNAALNKDSQSGTLPTTTTTDANGNVSAVTEDPTQPEAESQPNGTAGGTMQHFNIPDPSIGMQDAMAVAIPAGWHFQAQVVRNVPCSPGDPFVQSQAQSPDGRYSVTVMTPFFTTAQPVTLDLHTCGAVAPVSSSANILARYVVPALRRDAKASQPESVPGAEHFIQSQTRTMNGISMSADAARIRVSSTQNGQSIEEYIVGLTTISRMQGVPGGTTATTVEIYKAPAGKLDEFFQQASTTMNPVPNPAWQQRSAEMAQQAAVQAQQQGNATRAAILQNGQDAGAAGRAMLANTRNQIQATGQASMNAAARSEAARHSGAVGTADYVGDRPTSTYFFCNHNGQTTTNNNPNPPGPGWYPCPAR
jgi:hypothetical protein